MCLILCTDDDDDDDDYREKQRERDRIFILHGDFGMI